MLRDRRTSSPLSCGRGGMELSLESRAPRLSTLPAFSAETVFVRSPPRAHAEAIARLRAVVRTCGRAGSGNLRSTCLIYRSSRSSQLSPRPGWYCLAAERTDFAFETTFSGLTYVRRLQAWKQAGYRIEMVYLRLRSAQLAPRRIAARLRPGAATMCRGLTSSGGSQEAGGTFSASTARWPTAGPCTTIRAGHHDYWRRVREGENANEGKATPELCRWSRACFTPCGEGCAEDCAHVRHAALRVGKRQGCGEEAVRLVIGSPPAMQSYIRFVGIFCGYQYSGN